MVSRTSFAESAEGLRVLLYPRAEVSRRPAEQRLDIGRDAGRRSRRHVAHQLRCGGGQHLREAEADECLRELVAADVEALDGFACGLAEELDDLVACHAARASQVVILAIVVVR